MNDPTARPRWLHRALGPDGPELTCDECFEALDSYAELELRDADADAAVPGMSAHLEGCPACREDHDSLVALLSSDAGDPGHPSG